LLLITVATDKNDGFLRFMRSADIHGYDVKVSLCCVYVLMRLKNTFAGKLYDVCTVCTQYLCSKQATFAGE
jgi:hypothetical protein